MMHLHLNEDEVEALKQLIKRSTNLPGLHLPFWMGPPLDSIYDRMTIVQDLGNAKPNVGDPS